MVELVYLKGRKVVVQKNKKKVYYDKVVVEVLGQR